MAHIARPKWSKLTCLPKSYDKALLARLKKAQLLETMKRHKNVWLEHQVGTDWHIVSDGTHGYAALCGFKFTPGENYGVESVNLNWVQCEKCKEEYRNILCFHATGMTSAEFSKWWQKMEGEWDYVNRPEETNEQ